MLKTQCNAGVMLISILLLSGCASKYPMLYGAGTGTLTANAIFKFDEPERAMKDITVSDARDYGFSVTTSTEGGETCLVAHNRREAPVSVTIRITAEQNISSDQVFPLYEVVPPNSDRCIARIFPLEKRKDHAFRSASSWLVGDYTAAHYPKQGYRVPWARGETYRAVQAPGGPMTTHFDTSSRNAIDFNLPAGTPVMATRPGTVIGVADSFTVGGLDKSLLDKANYVDVLHDDGTIATYAHLTQHSTTVRVGQHVSTGDTLGLSGSTGYSAGPHLHFSVWKLEKADKGFERVSLPVEFCFDGKTECVAAAYRMALSGEGYVEYAERHEKSPVTMSGREK